MVSRKASFAMDDLGCVVGWDRVCGHDQPTGIVKEDAHCLSSPLVSVVELRKEGFSYIFRYVTLS